MGKISFNPFSGNLSITPTGGDAVVQSTPITITGKSIGVYQVGDVIPASTPLDEVLRNMLTTVTNPVYSAPTLLLSTPTTIQVEIGTTLSPVWTATWSQNDAGAKTSLIQLSKNGTPIHSSTTISSYTESAFRATTNYTYSASVDYAAGEVKLNNIGEPYPTGQIQAGTKTSNSITVTTHRKAFYGTSVSAPVSSANIRSLSNSVASPSNGSVITISAATGSSHVVLAYPASLRAVSSIKHIQGMNAEIKDAFTYSTINVEGAEGYQAISYRVYVFSPASPLASTSTYEVTI